jgi:hypothetical protein
MSQQISLTLEIISLFLGKNSLFEFLGNFAEKTIRVSALDRSLAAETG